MYLNSIKETPKVKHAIVTRENAKMYIPYGIFSELIKTYEVGEDSECFNNVDITFKWKNYEITAYMCDLYMEIENYGINSRLGFVNCLLTRLQKEAIYSKLQEAFGICETETIS